MIIWDWDNDWSLNGVYLQRIGETGLRLVFAELNWYNQWITLNVDTLDHLASFGTSLYDGDFDQDGDRDLAIYYFVPDGWYCNLFYELHSWGEFTRCLTAAVT